MRHMIFSSKYNLENHIFCQPMIIFILERDGNVNKPITNSAGDRDGFIRCLQAATGCCTQDQCMFKGYIVLDPLRIAYSHFAIPDCVSKPG